MTDALTLERATGGFIAAPDRPFLVGEQPRCCLGVLYPAPLKHERLGSGSVSITIRANPKGDEA